MRKLNQKMTAIMGISLLMTAISAYSPVFAETAEVSAEHQHEPVGFEWSGVYQGFTPCADCIGIKTSLALNKAETYLLITQFAGKSEREFVEKCKFSWNGANKTITLLPRNGGASQHYAVEANQLVLLDANGKRYTGKDADRYILRIKRVTEKAPSHSH